ncbi:MAG: ArdC-like ssDNA-binding domain-containing protein [Deinococcota bacterium]|jgi:antirestriction protein ArdC|nr:ArdC-like ssDNA-binding domain-containing protein [Deinococcota bacterium]
MSGPQPQKPNKALELLQKGMAELMGSESWKAALEVRAKLHAYSFNNCFLIQLQRPDATMVAGFNRWRDLGRQVRKGEKGIAILAPLTRKQEENGEERRLLFGFRTAHVFDVSQTDGEPIAEPPRPELLEEDGEGIREAIARLERYAESRGSRVERREVGAALGTFHRLTKAITLRPDLPPLQTLKTLVHELAHAILHAETTPGEQRHTRELEAESCAYVVCHSLGLDTSRYSFAYLASWAEDAAELMPAGERAVKAADEILGALAAPGLERAA